MLEGMEISHEQDSDSGNESMEVDKDDSKSIDFEAQPQLDPVGRLASKQACPAFGPLLRSKGFLWLASRPRISGEWSQAGVRPFFLASRALTDELSPAGHAHDWWRLEMAVRDGREQLA